MPLVGTQRLRKDAETASFSLRLFYLCEPLNLEMALQADSDAGRKTDLHPAESIYGLESRGTVGREHLRLRKPWYSGPRAFTA
jgi:hypothetical protein